MSVESTVTLKYELLNPKRLMNAVLSATSHARKFMPFWGPRGAWNVWISTVQSLVRSRFRVSDHQATDGNALVTILVITIHPDLIRLWYHFAIAFLDMQRTKILIVDSCGLLNPKLFPAARVVRFCNFSHARKIDYFIRHEIDTPYVWLCDDDSFILSKEALHLAYPKLSSDDNLAVVSLQPRGWSFNVNGQPHTAMGVYNILFSRDIFIRENLSFSPVRSKNVQVGRGTGYYDTGDYANEQLLLRGYDIETLGTENAYVKGFVGASSGLLHALSLKHAYAEMENEVKLDPKLASYYLVGLYCDWQVAQLYRQIFSAEPGWLPPLTEDQIRQFLPHLPAEIAQKTLALFERYNSHSHDLSRLASDLKQQPNQGAKETA